MISAEMVKTLREMTGAGMLECKKALEEAGGDLEKAKEILRIRGLAKAEKKAGRETKEGIVQTYISEDRKVGVIIELNCETDFVARNEHFSELALNIAKHIAQIPENANKEGTGEDVLKQPYFQDPSQTLEDVIKSAIAKIGENIQLRRFTRFDTDGFLHAYVHGIGRVGVLIDYQAEAINPQVLRVIQDIAMQIAAMKAEFVDVSSIPAEVIQREKRILSEQARQEGKPENIIDKVVEGRIKKFYQEKVLLEQPFIKDDKKTVGQYLRESAPGVVIKRFVRYELGGA
ncbi:MAG: elongation factor Ts [Hydrogenobacter thermophilus]|uniref:Elongation factor Ts n=1 Tax=Hydrogenobacter thermophilus (strain DSM 6534 / IAM 12695 / TK-6) TaxID=608538 RepID=D3DH51_HYDTT|nr:translation elongation factor Ts [Hydrogenobacter thermophilus]ADO45090.1 translation elongation factor Ts [Hydrogenobacter thermophilus TK-6]QWK19928.1 MAG: elongation factor Ts [Hydrogenobacter thermophilus]BAI69153.1 translation elongation factor Ts [Hydrogenobacter thermophilus TK-6]